jgi:hypothetical protein
MSGPTFGTTNIARVASSAVTFASLLAATIVSIVWFFEVGGQQRWEPAVTALALIAAFTGIYAERWALASERRREAWAAIRSECERNLQIFADERFDHSSASQPQARVYPRFSNSSALRVLGSSPLSLRGHSILNALLFEWTLVCAELNHRLDLTEMLVFTHPSMDMIESFAHTLGRDRGPLHDGKKIVEQIRDITIDEA